METTTFDMLLHQVPYIVKATPFRFNDETRFTISYNGGPDHIFAWDDSTMEFTAIDDDASAIPDEMENAISLKLQLLLAGKS
ncbi:hypothetical protein ACFOTA_23860 [Chitinophaga sp. GCM10012297]|uniref:Large polyvalent protein associated domain-containing protein n=1 Tax=Chitinophaga chungangae TaxID=2821488 RepID=A0ABS3YKP1_9BACT|nr:hypothetical protein [Chitinophaga chungangae]MBO9155267.1 hypothetical protein [Chitinophaga chungangae]